MALTFTPAAPWADGASVTDQHGNSYTYDAACGMLVPAASGGGGTTIVDAPCPTASTEAGNFPVANTAPVTPPAAPVNGQQHYETWDDVRVTWAYCNGAWTKIDEMALGGGGTTVNAPCPTASTEAGNFPVANTTPATPPAAPVNGQQHYETWDDKRVTWAFCNGAWTKIDEMALGGGGGGITISGPGGGAQVSGTMDQSSEWYNFLGSTSTVPLLARRGDGTYGIFSLSIINPGGAGSG